MEELPLFQEVLKKLNVYKHTFNMKAFGAPSLKPTWLYASILLQYGSSKMFVVGEVGRFC